MTATVTQAGIREALERNVRALELRPAMGIRSATTRVELTEGLACRATEGDTQLASDMSEKMGGAASAPNPGTIGRTALGTCMATCMRVAFGGITVDVIAEYDARGELGVDDTVPPGYTRVTFRAHVVSPEPEERIRELFDMAERHTAWLDLLRRPVDTAVELQVERSA